MQPFSVIRTFAAAVVFAAVVTSLARADIVYDTATGSTPYANPFGPAPMLDDMTISLIPGTPPTRLTQVTFGARNASSLPAVVDLLLTLFEGANTGATGSTVVEQAPVIATVRLSLILVPASGTATYTMPLPTTITMTDATAAVRMTFVEPTTTVVSEDVDALLSPNLPTVGTTADRYWTDQGVFNQSFVGNEVVIPDPFDPNTHTNFYLRFEGEAIPEPACLTLVATSLLLLKRRTPA